MVLLLVTAPRGEASGSSIAQPLWYIVNSTGVSMCYSSTRPALMFIHCCCASPTCVSSPSSACHGRWITGAVSPRTNVGIQRQRRGEKCSLGQRLSDMLHHLAESTPMVLLQLYAESVARFQGGSPYIYPLYGLGELPQGFARLSAVYGGTYMLNKPECKVEFDEEGKVRGVTSEGETAKCKKVVCDPSYLPEKVKKVGKVFRAIAIMSHPIPNTAESHSVQIILPQKQLGRRSDMYVFCCSYSHNVASKGKFIAFVSAQAESDNPEAELKPGIDLLGPVDELFIDTYDRYEPANDPSTDNCFISTSYDATTHFESTVMDVLSLYTKITGKTVDLSVDLSAASAAEDDF